MTKSIFQLSQSQSQFRKNLMFGMKSKKEKLKAKLAKRHDEAYKLSHTDRYKSDEKTIEAEKLKKRIDAMD